jgi:N6-adenosine-specific RNA methylase IME4
VFDELNNYPRHVKHGGGFNLKNMNKKYQIIYADPPWDYQDKGCQGTMANHYQGMKLEDIKKLPVGEVLADKDCILFLWATYPMLKEALEVIEAWGFKYKTIAFQWIKQNPKKLTPFYGLGRWTRGNSEPCLLATKGKPKRISASVFQLIEYPRSRHSKKPPCTRDKIIQLVGNLPRIELFARQKTGGWDVWGNEVKSDIDFN